MAVSKFIPQPYYHFLTCCRAAKALLNNGSDPVKTEEAVKKVFLARQCCVQASRFTLLAGVGSCVPTLRSPCAIVCAASYIQDSILTGALWSPVMKGVSLSFLATAHRVHIKFAALGLMFWIFSYAGEWIYSTSFDNILRETNVSPQDLNATEKWIRECKLF